MALTDGIAITFGRPVKVNSAIANTGTATSQYFVLPNDSFINWGQMTIQGVRTNTTDFSALVVSLEVSLDGGLTFGPLFSGLDLVAGCPIVNLNGGACLYRFNVTSRTTANGATADIWVAIG